MDFNAVAQQQQQQLMQQQLLMISQTVNDKCFRRCFEYPRSKMEAKDQQCLSDCKDAFLEVYKLSNELSTARFEDAARKHGGGGY
mmetsp:Transcript_128013/g.311157  ORF Transcript_128013/g.311157 Transcript_128013/m.311157 type:complete len:85 (-) Transcript_128013:74-328(-)